MDIKVFNESLELIGLIDNFKSLIWTRRYSKCGDFQLVTLATEESIKLLQKKNIIYKGNGDTEAGYIDTVNIKLNNDGQEVINVSGKFITGYLGRRIIWGNENLNCTSELAMRTLVDKNGISCDASRIIPGLQLDTLKGYIEIVTKSISYANLLKSLEDIANTSNLGYRNNLDYINKKIKFEVYKGIDRTVSQSSITPCIFSRDFENILEQEYTDSNNNYCNTALICGEGEGINREKAYVGTSNIGFNRYELYVDAKDLRKEVDNKTLTPEEYTKVLEQRGKEKIEECPEIKTFESKVNTKGNNKYRVDYDLGDIVTAMDKKWGITIDTRIVQIEEVYEGGKCEIRPTFGNNIPTIIDKLKRMVM